MEEKSDQKLVSFSTFRAIFLTPLIDCEVSKHTMFAIFLFKKNYVLKQRFHVSQIVYTGTLYITTR